MRVLILGATGLVGRHTLARALADARIGQVIAPSRRALASPPKLVNPVAQQLESLLHEADHWPLDAVICAMGTTIGKAGSKEAFRHVDYELPLAFATRAIRQGAHALALVSSPGASLSVPLYYNRTKGELERDVEGLGYTSLTIIRPGMIGGDRKEFRIAERLVLPVAAVLRPLLPKGLWINPARRIADILVDAVIAGKPGLHRLISRDVVEYLG
jgi:uncharacterized protein YbjT (DUF2867 family)